MENKKQSIHILIIEDDEDDYIIITSLLSEIKTNEFKITWAKEYHNALKLLEEYEFDICLLDYRLGTHDGLEILDKLSNSNNDVPVIFLTGQGEYSIDVLAMEAGASDYIVKDNLAPSILERSIRYSIDRAKASREIRDAHEKLEEKVRERTSELINANYELKKASEKIQFFAYYISHDIKSPATALVALTRRLRDNYSQKLGEKGATYCEQILAASRQIISLVENINLFISEKEMPLSLEIINLNELLREIKTEFSDIIINRRITWKSPENLPLINADRLSILRALRNLVENALKYGGENLSNVGIKFEETHDEYILSVIDDGSGLMNNEGKDVFLPFERTCVDKKIEGSGLGLAIVKEIAEKHGGEVWTEHENVKGATFCFSISKNL